MYSCVNDKSEFLQNWYFEIWEMWHRPRAKAIDWNRINPLAKDYDLFLMHNLEVSHIRILIGLSAADYFFSPSFLSLTGFMVFPLTQCRPHLGPSVFLYFPTMCLNQMNNTCSAANIIMADLQSHNSSRLPFPNRVPPSFFLSPFLNIRLNVCECQFIKSAVQRNRISNPGLFSVWNFGTVFSHVLDACHFSFAVYFMGRRFDLTNCNFYSMWMTDPI